MEGQGRLGRGLVEGWRTAPLPALRRYSMGRPSCSLPCTCAEPSARRVTCAVAISSNHQQSVAISSNQSARRVTCAEPAKQKQSSVMWQAISSHQQPSGLINLETASLQSDAIRSSKKQSVAISSHPGSSTWRRPRCNQTQPGSSQKESDAIRSNQ